MVAEFGMDVALELEVDATAPFTPSHFTEELHGMADATGISFKKVQCDIRVHARTHTHACDRI